MNNELWMGLGINPCDECVVILGYHDSESGMADKCRERVKSEEEAKDVDRWTVFQLLPSARFDPDKLFKWLQKNDIPRSEAVQMMRDIGAELKEMMEGRTV
jgi:hypothetical protein